VVLIVDIIDLKFMKKHIFSEKQAVIFDLELTSWPGTNERNWSLPDEHREIIQIGAVKIETKEDMLETNTFQIFVQSRINPILSDYIIDLTGITQEKIDRDGVSFPFALSRFINFIGERPINIFCNGDDKIVIEENCKIYDIPFPSVIKQTFDLKNYFSEILGISRKECISGKLPELFGFKNNGKIHTGLGDARSISRALKHLRMKEKVS
jgi:inhibitor of KinA sporulation pathway (predicted exonuclease)